MLLVNFKLIFPNQDFLKILLLRNLDYTVLLCVSNNFIFSTGKFSHKINQIK